MRATYMYASPAGAASSSLAMLPTQPSVPEVEFPHEEENDDDENDDASSSANRSFDSRLASVPVLPASQSANLQRSSPMARSSSQRRISLELSLGGGGVVSSNANGGMQASPRNLRTPVGPSASNLLSGTPLSSSDDYRFPSSLATPTRQAPPIRRHSGRLVTTSSGLSSSVQGSSSSASHELSRGADYFSSDITSSSDSFRVPFPSSASMNNAHAHLESPSNRRIARHVSLSAGAGASTESLPVSSPKNAGAIPIPPRPVYRHLRYSSDLHVNRTQMMAASRSDVSIDEKSRSRVDSEVGSLYTTYTNTLGSLTTNEENCSASGVRLTRDLSQSVPHSKHKLVVMEEGKPVVTYQMGNCIGRGQFGSVYRALNLNTGQMVAVKRIKLEGLAEDEVTQLMGEVDLLKSLSHPSVVKYEGLVRGPEVVSIILEFVENGSLSHTLKAFGTFPEKLVASYVVKILEGLNYLHGMKVVHCDLKAANILTTKNGNVKLSDFGVSLNLKAVENIKNDAIGTPNWMAPEVIELKGASTAADIWSLGCTIIELLTGKPPYGDMLAMSALWRIVEDDCPPFPENISAPLRDFLIQCFRKDPALRPSAEMLFEHEWLRKTWTGHKELRMQDSVPFLRRISADARRMDARTLHSAIKKQGVSTLTPMVENQSQGPEPKQNQMARSSSSPPASLSVRPRLTSMRAASAPDAWSHPTPIEEGVMSLSSEQTSPVTPAALSLASSPPAMSYMADLGVRRGSDGNVSFEHLRSNSSLAVEKDRRAVSGGAISSTNGGGGSLANGGPPASSEPPFLDLNAIENGPLDEHAGKMHAFVKITFSKAVVCKICRDPVKKHAVLCEECGLICHASCTKKAISPCNLRTQLLIFASQAGGRSSMDLVRGVSPAPSHRTGGAISPTLSGSHDTPPLSPRLFKIPFRSKRLSNAAAPISIPVEIPASPTTTAMPTTPTMPLTPLSAVTGTPSSDHRKRRISLLPYIGRRRTSSPAPEPMVSTSMSMTRSLSSATSIPDDSRHDDSLGYGSSISSVSSSGPPRLSMVKSNSSSSGGAPPLPVPKKSHLHRHSVAVAAAASTPQLIGGMSRRDLEAERKAKRRQSASAQRVTTPHELVFPRMPQNKVQMERLEDDIPMAMPTMQPVSVTKRSRRLSTRQDCLIM